MQNYIIDIHIGHNIETQFDTQSKQLARLNDYFWCMMRHAVILIQNCEDLDRNQSKTIEKKSNLLIKECDQYFNQNNNKTKKKNKKNHHMAYCYATFGLWMFQAGDIRKSKKYIQIAIQADDFWGYPEYLMGWLGFFDNTIDSAQHFVNAVSYNWAFFHAIHNNAFLRQYPVILRQVRQNSLILVS